MYMPVILSMHVSWVFHWSLFSVSLFGPVFVCISFIF